MELTDETRDRLRQMIEWAFDNKTIKLVSMEAGLVEGVDPSGQWVTHEHTGINTATVTFQFPGAGK